MLMEFQFFIKKKKKIILRLSIDTPHNTKLLFDDIAFSFTILVLKRSLLLLVLRFGFGFGSSFSKSSEGLWRPSCSWPEEALMNQLMDHLWFVDEPIAFSCMMFRFFFFFLTLLLFTYNINIFLYAIFKNKKEKHII